MTAEEAALKRRIKGMRSFCGSPDCPCVNNSPEVCEEWCDPGEDAPEGPFSVRCARCGHGRHKHPQEAPRG
jgi:hypothetical protein